MEQLIIGETDRGTYYVRPMSWAGIWDKDGKLSGCNTPVSYTHLDVYKRQVMTGPYLLHK